MTDLFQLGGTDIKRRVARLNARDWRWLPALADDVLQAAITIQQIPAPTFDEGERAAAIAARFRQLGLESVIQDDLHNVFGRLPGSTRAPGLMIVAHLDTVFPKDADLRIKRVNGLVRGPGIGDNSLGVAGMLGLAQTIIDRQIAPQCDIWFVATSREEGLGDLGGMRAVFERLAPQVAMVLNLEGMAFGHVYHAGIAVRRLHITARTEGGHSWAHYGRPSAVHSIMRLGAQITGITPSTRPRTTYNIGVVEGGQSINTIASSASMWLDLRSEERGALEAFESEVRQYIDQARQEGITLEVEVVGDRPAGGIPAEHALVQTALSALDQVGVRGTLATGSTDGNVSLAAGCPTITLGVTRGGNAHRLDEYIEVAPIADGMRQLLLVTLALLDNCGGP
ncbi:MAG: M20/M25/M40 family metallo-hydrolase [Chloroflexota bacterium]